VNKNTVVGWIVLLFIVFFVLACALYAATAMDHPATATTTCTHDYTTCTVSYR
jgi:hypothetical protein